MTDYAPTLFLHGGPGSSAIAERALYGRRLPIHWWDQPRSVALFAKPFAALVDAAQEKLERLARVNPRPVNLIAHSFGAHLALRLAMRLPDRLGKILLLAPVYDVEDAFVRLASRLRMKDPSFEPLVAALDESRRNGDPRRFSKVASQLVSIANFLDLYWSPEASARRRWYTDLLTQQPIIDLNTFEVVLENFWLDGAIGLSGTVVNSVDLVVGDMDPLMDIEKEYRIWTTFFPHAVCYEVEGGHFIHLEKAADHWWKCGTGSTC